MILLERSFTSYNLNAPYPISAALRTPVRYSPDSMCLNITSAPYVTFASSGCSLSLYLFYRFWVSCMISCCARSLIDILSDALYKAGHT